MSMPMDLPTLPTRVVTEVIRDLTIIGVPPVLHHLEDNEQLKQFVIREVTTMFLTRRRVTDIGGTTRDIPPMLGVPREWDVTIIRRASDLDGYTIDHADCESCVTAINELRLSVDTDVDVELPKVAVVQFTFDQMIGVE